MAEQSIESVNEGLRRDAVRAIADSGRRAAETTDRTGSRLAQGAQSALQGQLAPERASNVRGLAAELQAIVSPAAQVAASWAGDRARFEQADTSGRLRSATDFFDGADSALPIVRSGADATRAGGEADLLNAILGDELSVGQQGFNFRQALEGRTRAREDQAFAQQAHAQNMALAQERLAFEQAEAARAIEQAEQAESLLAPAAGRTLGGWGQTRGRF